MQRCQLNVFRATSLLLAMLLIGSLTEATTWAQGTGPTPAPPALTPVAVPLPNSVRLGKEVAPSGVLQPGQDATVKLRFQGQSLTGCFGMPVQPVDVVVYIDISQSAWTPNRERARQILRSLWAQMDQPIYQTPDGQAVMSRLAIVTVDEGKTAPDEPRVRLPFTNSVTAIGAAIEGWQAPGADTGFDKGIALASQLLAEQGRREAKPVLIVLLHDNYFFDEKGVNLAAGRKAAERADVFVIGNRLGISNAPLTQVGGDQDKLAGSPSRVFLDPSAEDLRRLFVMASGGSPAVWGRVFRVYEEIAPFDLVEMRRSDVANNGDLQDNRILWDARATGLQAVGLPVQLGYSFRIVANPSQTRLTLTTRADFVDCNGFWHAAAEVGGLLDIAVASQARITPSSTPTDRPTTTVTPTATRAPEGGTTVAPTPTSRGVPPPPTPPEPTPCVIVVAGIPLPCWILWLLPILLILLALLVWWLWSHWRKQPEPTREKPKKPETPEQKPPVLPKPKEPDGKQITPEPAPEDTALLALLRTADSFVGRIPPAPPQYGFGSSHVAVRAFSSDAELRGRAVPTRGEAGLNLEAMGPSFLWQVEEGGERIEHKVPTSLLQQVLCERIAPEKPLAAVWTLQPADNAKLEMRTAADLNAKQIRIQARRTYALPKPGQPTPEKAYWLLLRFLSNSDRWTVSVMPAVEAEN